MPNSRTPSRRSSTDLRQQTLLSSSRRSWSPAQASNISEYSTNAPGGRSSPRSSLNHQSMASFPEWPNNPICAPPASLLNSRRSSLASIADSSPPERTGCRWENMEIFPDGYETPVLMPEMSNEDGRVGDGEVDGRGNFLTEEDDGKRNFRKSLQIDMKGLFGDDVGNMSISPSSRDLVLAARRGLFIIDLEAPLEIPRFLPQGGTWDVADVQWNPHPSRAEYIVSTSSEKMLIWNLLLVGKTSIEHILQAHYRAITDINWHTYECDTVISIGIDSWLWAWDLREPRKPIFGLSTFEAGGTQVKWNRNDANILASSHGNDVFIWDRRKGSLPITRIKAHSSKIYGIDWAHTVRNEIVTCSLDKTIKFWNIGDPPPFSASCTDQEIHDPVTMIKTPYPVWRARNLPFGKEGGVLSLAQRSEAALEMWAQGCPEAPVERFEGHADVVKEFVWRKGGEDVFQLITWSKDRTLRFWPVDDAVMRSVGHHSLELELSEKNNLSETPKEKFNHGYLGLGHAKRVPFISFRNPPEGMEYLPALSVPVGHRSILAEVRAGIPPKLTAVSRHCRTLSGSGDEPGVGERWKHESMSRGKERIGRVGRKSKPSLASARNRGETMSVGPVNGSLKSGVQKMQMDSFTWLSKVKVGTPGLGGAHSNSAGTAGLNLTFLDSSESGARIGEILDSADSPTLDERSISSRFNTHSRQVSVGDFGMMKEVRIERGSQSRTRGDDGDRDKIESRERDSGQTQTLQDEITSVLTKLSTPKIKLEKHDLTKRRTCTFGLYGPWGESSLVFIRVTFTFPKSYPQATYPDGIPIADLERNPLISLKDRAFILRRLTTIREYCRPCLENCLRFLLFREEGRRLGDQDPLQIIDAGESSSEDDYDRCTADAGRREGTVTSKQSKNLVEPRTSQGTFGPNGELVCFFRDPTRIIRNDFQRPLDASGTQIGGLNLLEPTGITTSESPLSRTFQSPSIIYDAVRRLSASAKYRSQPSVISETSGRRAKNRSNISRIMTNLLTFSHHKCDAEAEGGHTKHLGDILRNFALLTPRRSTVLIEDTTNISGSDRRVAVDYLFQVENGSLCDVCSKNAQIAKRYGRVDHERAFNELNAVFAYYPQNGEVHSFDFVGLNVVTGLYSNFAETKDLQMLAMLSSLLLQFSDFDYLAQRRMSLSVPRPADYFNLKRNSIDHSAPTAFWSRRPSVHSVTTHIDPSPNSPRSSWSSLFGTSSVRQFMSNVQGTLMDGLSTPDGLHFPALEAAITQNKTEKSKNFLPEPLTTHVPVVEISRENRNWQTQRKLSNSKPQALVLSSWSVTRDRMSLPLKPLSDTRNLGQRSGGSSGGKRVIVFNPPVVKMNFARMSLDPTMLEQCQAHIYAYAELLLRWQLYHRRLELLKSVRDTLSISGIHTINLSGKCGQCIGILSQSTGACSSCRATSCLTKCSICRLPIKGLSRSCFRCLHVTHIECWDELDASICPTGCGCLCNGIVETQSLISRQQETVALYTPKAFLYFP